jgi:hypothetical protein
MPVIMNQALAGSLAGRVILHLRDNPSQSVMDLVCALRINKASIYTILQTLECIGAARGTITYAEHQIGKPPILWSITDWASERIGRVEPLDSSDASL